MRVRWNGVDVQGQMVECPLVAVIGRLDNTPHLGSAVSAATDESVPLMAELNAVYLVIVRIQLRNSAHCSRLVETVHAQNVFSTTCKRAPTSGSAFNRISICFLLKQIVFRIGHKPRAILRGARRAAACPFGEMYGMN